MNQSKILMSRKWLLGLRMVVIILSLISLTAELMPEVEAKRIVIPALVLAIIACMYDIQKGDHGKAKT